MVILQQFIYTIHRIAIYTVHALTKHNQSVRTWNRWFSNWDNTAQYIQHNFPLPYLLPVMHTYYVPVPSILQIWIYLLQVSYNTASTFRVLLSKRPTLIFSPLWKPQISYRLGSVLSPTLFDVIFNEIVMRAAQGQHNWIPTIMV
jgi:hypothetical protein